MNNFETKQTKILTNNFKTKLIVVYIRDRTLLGFGAGFDDTSNGFSTREKTCYNANVFSTRDAFLYLFQQVPSENAMTCEKYNEIQCETQRISGEASTSNQNDTKYNGKSTILMPL